MAESIESGFSARAKPRSGARSGSRPHVQSADLRARQLAELERLDRIAHLMDRAFRVPGTSFRFGWDGIIGLVPVLGDTLAVAPAAYIIGRAHGLGVPKSLILRMVTNLGIDWAIGLVPLLGDVLDVSFKANHRNVQLLRRHFDAPRMRDITP